MNLTKEKAKENLAKLVEKFDRELSSGAIWEYNEEATKIGFIQPLLKDILGWDVNDRNEVSPEEKVSRGRVDYGLKIDGKTKILVEAKPVKEELKKHISQAVNYGYNRKNVPFVLLTDFEGLKLFDVTIKPDVRNPLKGLKIDIPWSQYIQEFDDLWKISRQSVIEGELDKLLLIKPKDRLPVDQAILGDLKKWSEDLAKNIFKNNTALFHGGDTEQGAAYLKEITQRILDRIIFMRSCEDRGLIHHPPLVEIFAQRTEGVGLNTMLFLREEFKYYDETFDSDLFRPRDWEKDLAIDFSAMLEIINGTYNPYQFDVIPIEVLGNIYEQYLGYTLRLTAQQVKYELKPELRKAGGVYYTPEYVVDYIVKNTVGKLLNEYPAKKIETLRILDPACGSGSFLIRAYDEMLNYYKSQKAKKIKSSEKQGKLDLRHEETGPPLTIQEKSEILRKHIFGVDVDEQAVEVTKLSLMLKMLEGMYGFVPGRAILPMLDRNIRCGNSLVSGDTLELKNIFGNDWYKLKSFNWNTEFLDIMEGDGFFDVVIGNPPYVRQEMLGEKFKSYAETHFKTYSGTADLYTYFIEKSIGLLKKNGLFSFIVANKWQRANYGKPLRRWLKTQAIEEIVDFGDLPVFAGVTTYPCILRIAKGNPQPIFNCAKMDTLDFKDMTEHVNRIIYKISRETLEDNGWSLSDDKATRLITILRQKGIPLKEYAKGKILYGIKTGLNEAFVIDSETRKHLISDDSNSAELIKPFLMGRDVRRYEPPKRERFVIFTRRGVSISKYPAIERHLSQFKEFLIPKPADWSGKEWKGRKPGNYKWYEIQDTVDYFEEFEKTKIIVPTIIRRAAYIYDREGFYSNDKTTIIAVDDLYLLGLLNSKLLDYFMHTISSTKQGGYYEYKPMYIEQLPIRTISHTSAKDKTSHKQIVELVKQMIDLHKKLSMATTERERSALQRSIAATDHQIDNIVYELYGLSEHEIKIVEESIKQ